MNKRIVVRDAKGNVINIGEWDYKYAPVMDEEKGVVAMVPQNPLPAGATSSEEEIITLADGGLAAAD